MLLWGCLVVQKQLLHRCSALMHQLSFACSITCWQEHCRCVGFQEPHDLYSQLMDREARHAAATHAGHQPKQTWNTLPVGLPVNPQLDLTAVSNNHSSGFLYSTSARRCVLNVWLQSSYQVVCHLLHYILLVMFCAKSQKSADIFRELTFTYSYL